MAADIWEALALPQIVNEDVINIHDFENMISSHWLKNYLCRFGLLPTNKMVIEEASNTEHVFSSRSFQGKIFRYV